MISRNLRLTLPAACLALTLALAACGGGDDPAADSVWASPAVAFTDPQSTYDLANYTQVGRYSLPVGSGFNLLASEASGVTYNSDTDTLFVVGDEGTSVVQVSLKGVLVDSMTLQAGVVDDPEGIVYLGSGRFGLVEERTRQIREFTYAAGTVLDASGLRTVKLGTTIGNIGIEGMTLDPMTQGLIGVKEKEPLGVFQTTVDFAAGTASNGSATTDDPVNLFAPDLTGLSAHNDVFALSNVLSADKVDYSHLLILSAPDGKLVKIDRSGNIQSTLVVGSAAQNEGVAMDGKGNIYVVSEVGGGADKPELLVFAPATSTGAVAPGSHVYLSFSQAVSLGSGDVTISNGQGDSRTIAIGDSTQVSLKGTTLVINPKADLRAGTSYSVTYAAGLLKNGQGQHSPAMNDATKLRFTVAGTQDTTAPTLSSSTPADNATAVTGSRIELVFSEPVFAGSGSIVISNGAGDTRTVSVTDASQVSFNGATVTINLSAALLGGNSYSVQMASGVIRDAVDLPFAGISDATTLNFSTAATGLVHSLLITELNSNATGGDFFEIYNYGTAAVDLSGWKWDDDSADAGIATAVGNVTLAAGQRLVVVAAADTGAFNTAWGNPVANVVASDGPGLGKGDAVVLFDAAGKVATALSYGAASIKATDSTVVSTAAAASGVSYVAGAHAGLAYGGAGEKTSMVWDGVSTSSPAYKAAQVGVSGGVAQAGDATAIGSPGQ
jgi:uncharacterized protein YjiK/methionine-rich copper-binding protein CopC